MSFRRLIIPATAAIIVSIVATVVWSASPPPIITYQGKVLVSGSPASTTLPMQFTVYNALSGGTALYTASGSTSSPTNITVTTTQGLFTVYLGDNGTNPINPEIFKDNDTLYLQVVINGEALNPRKRLATTPYALNSKYLDGYIATSTPTTTNYIPVSDASGNFSFNNITSTNIVVQKNNTSGVGSTISVLSANGNAVAGLFNYHVDSSTYHGILTLYSSVDDPSTPSLFFNAAPGGSSWIKSKLSIGTTTIPWYDLDVAGDINFTGNLYQDGVLFPAGSLPSGILGQFLVHNGSDWSATNTFTTTTFVTDILPSTHLTYTLGNSSSRFSEGWFENVYIGSSTWKLGQDENNLLTFTDINSSASSALAINNQGFVGFGISPGSAKVTIRDEGGVVTTSKPTNVRLIGFLCGDGMPSSLQWDAKVFAFKNTKSGPVYSEASISLNSPKNAESVCGPGVDAIPNWAWDAPVDDSVDGYIFNLYLGAPGYNNWNIYAITQKTTFEAQNGDYEGDNLKFTSGGPFDATPTSGFGSLRNRDSLQLSYDENSYAAIKAYDTGALSIKTNGTNKGLYVSETGNLKIGSSFESSAKFFVENSQTGLEVIMQNSLSPNIQTLKVIDNTLYAIDRDPATGNKTFVIYDVTNKFSPSLISTIPPPVDSEFVKNLEVSGNYAYIEERDAVGDVFIGIYNISNPASVSRVSQISNSNSFVDYIKEHNGRLYFSTIDITANPILRIYDISSGFPAGHIIDINLNSNAYKFIINNDFLYYYWGSNVEIIDLNNISNTSNRGVPEPINDIYILGDYLYVANGWRITIFEKVNSDPLNLDNVGDVWSENGNFTKIKVINSYLYGSINNGSLAGVEVKNAINGNYIDFYRSSQSNIGTFDVDNNNYVFTIEGIALSSILKLNEIENPAYAAIFNGGSVGIGTTNPEQTLSVVGNIGVTKGLYFGRNSRSSDTNYSLYSEKGNLYWNGSSLSLPSGSVFGQTLYYDGWNWQASDNLINTGWNIGIGNSSPSYRLDVGGDINFTGTLYQNGTPFSSGSSLPSGLPGDILVNDSFGNWTNSSYIFVSSSSGFVGLNNSNPSDRLSIYGGVDITGMLKFGSTGGTTNQILMINPYTLLPYWTNTSSLGISGGSAAGSIGEIQFNDGTGSFDATSTFVWDNVNGRLGIGTSTPSESLTVVGNISNPITAQSGVRQISTASVGTNPASIYVSGKYAYVANAGSHNISIVDISNPTAPVQISTASVGTGPASIYVSGKYAYVANLTSNNISIVDISNPTAPVQISTTSVGTNPLSIYVSGKYAYVANVNSNNISIVDISNPTAPVQISTTSVGTGPYSIYVSGKYAYVANLTSNNISIVDITGTEVSSLIAHSAEAGNLSIRNDLSVKGNTDLSVLTVGQGGILSQGPVAVSAGLFIASTTPATTSYALYNQGGSLYWNGSAVGGGSGSLPSGTDGQILMVSSTGQPYWTSTSSLGISGGSAAGSIGEIQFNDGAGSFDATSTFVWDNVNGRLGIGVDNPLTKLHIAGDGAILATGTVGTGWDGETLGRGSRLMWIPNKAAFRAGYVENSEWNNSNIGDYSAAFGYGGTASGVNSFIGGGYGNVVSGSNSFVAGGWYSGTYGNNSFVAAGGATSASGEYAVAFGRNLTVSGNYTFGINLDEQENSYSLSQTSTMAIMGGKVGIGTVTPSERLTVIGNISNPIASNSEVRQISTASVGTGPASIYVSGKYAYVANRGSNNISIVDISNPTAPVQISTASVGMEPYSIYVSGKYAYVANIGSHNISIVDISNPTAPVQISTASVGSLPFSIYVSGKYAYVANRSSKNISIVDISNPTAPVQISTASVGIDPRSIYVSGKYAYVANTGSNNISIVDISNPTAPVQISTASVGIDPYSIYVSGKYAYVANIDSYNISIVDISNPTAPVQISTTSVGTAPASIYVSGKYAYVANEGSNNISIVDISNPTAPVQISTASVGINPRSIYVSGKYAYVANRGSNNISIVDITGTEVSSLIAHSAEAGNLSIRNDLSVKGNTDLSVLTVGQGGILSQGPVAVSAGLFIASTTPATTTYALYNQGGSLYWNGSPVGGGPSLPSGSIGQILVNNGEDSWVTSSIISVNTTTGFVGIGTTTPNSPLTVYGTTTINNGGLAFNNYAGVNGQILMVSSTGRPYWTNTSSLGISAPSLPTGSVGQTLRHDGANWTANSLLYNDGSFIGIGTTTPSTLLFVSGTSTLQNVVPNMTGAIYQNVSQYSLGASTTRWNSVWANIYNVGSSTWSITQKDGRFSIFDQAGGIGNERFSVLNNGRIGINNTNPEGLFQVSTDPIVGPASPTGAAGTINYGYATGWSNIGTTHSIRVYAYKEIGGIKYYSSSYSDASVTDNASGGDSYGITWSWNSVPEATGYKIVKYDGVSWSLAAYRIGTSLMDAMGDNSEYFETPEVTPTGEPAISFVFADSGNVGIGTTTPEYLLSVAGDVNITGQYLINGSPLGGLPTGSAGQILVNNGGSNWIASNAISVNTTTNNVGIGTTTPSNPLHIYQNVNVWNTLSLLENANDGISSTAFLSLKVGEYGGSLGVLSENYNDFPVPNLAGQTVLMGGGPDLDSNGLALIGLGTTGTISFYTTDGLPSADKERMRINTEGYVSIGTTTAETMFVVAGTTTLQNVVPNMTGAIYPNVSQYSLGASTTRWNNVWANTYNVGSSTWSITQKEGRFSIFDQAGGIGNESFSILSNGNVGIGTSTANQKLTIAGNVNIIDNGNIQLNGQNVSQYFITSSGTSGQVLTANSEGSFSWIDNPWKKVMGESWSGISVKMSDTARFWYSVDISSDGQYQTAVAYSGYIWRSVDYGNNWAQKSLLRSWSDVAVSSNGQYQTAVINAYSNSGIRRSTDYGDNWTSMGYTDKPWSSVAMSSDGQYQTALVYGGNVWRSIDYGANWTEILGTSASWQSVAMSSNGQYQTAVGSGGFIWRSTNYGASWMAILGATRNWNSVTMSSDGQYQTAVVSDGDIWTSSDYGVSWTQIDSVDKLWRDVTMSSDGQYQTAVVNGGDIWTSSNYGASWTQTNNINRNWWTVAMSSDGQYQTAGVGSGYLYLSSPEDKYYNLNNIALGTSTIDSNKFTVSGNVNIVGNGKIIFEGSAGSPGQLLMVSSSGQQYWAGSSSVALAVFPTGSPGQILVNNGGTSWSVTSSLFVSSSGNIGIGTTTPNSKLTVVGTSTLQNLFPSMVGESDYMSLYNLGDGTARWNNLWVNSINLGESNYTDKSKWSFVQTSTLLNFNYNFTESGDPTSILSLSPTSITASGSLSVLGGIYQIPRKLVTSSIGLGGGGETRGLFVSGGNLYIAGYDDGLYIYNENNELQSLSTFDEPASSSFIDVAVSGNYAYITISNASLGTSTFKIIDISSIKTPFVVGSVDLGMSAINLVIHGNYAYVQSGSFGLTVINITDAQNPYIEATTGIGFNKFYISGDYLYAAVGSNGLRIYDISNRTSPVLKGTYNTPGIAEDVYVSGNYAYVADRGNSSVSSSVQVIEISSSTNPAFVNEYKTYGFNGTGEGGALGIFVSGDFICVADGYGGLVVLYGGAIVDRVKPPALLANTYSEVFMSGDKVYLGGGSWTSEGGVSVYLLQGMRASSLIAGSSDIGNLQIRNDLSVKGKADLISLTVGKAGIFSQGDIVAQGDIFAQGDMVAQGNFSMDGGSLSVINTGSYNYFAGSVGIGTSLPFSKLHINDGALLITGSTGTTPISGAGTRLMWVPEKAAFRAGAVTGAQWNNANIGDYSAAFGFNNIASATNTFIGGGDANIVTGPNSFIGGGSANNVSGYYSAIIGGRSNEVLEGESSIIGGFGNISSGEKSSIIGGSFNEIATGTFSSIVGGASNFVGGTSSAIIGGQNNNIQGEYSFIAGGQNNTSTGNYSFIGGGGKNILNSERSFIGGGYENTILSSGDYSFIAGGRSNVVSNTHSFIAGGEGNIVGGKYSFIGAGKNSEVNGNYSAAFGYGIEVNGTSSFGFSLDNIGGYTIEGGSIMAIMGGKVGIGTTTPSSTFTVVGDTQLFGGFEVSPSSSSSTVKGWVSPDDGSWVNSSDENLKKNIIDFTGSLEKVKMLRPVSYEFKNEKDAGGTTHIGLLAQEIEQIFPQVVSKNSSGLKGISYANLTPILVQAIQEQQEQIDALKNASTTLTIENTDGQIVYTVDMGQDMLGRPLLNVASVVGSENKWEIDTTGLLKNKISTSEGDKEIYGLTSENIEITLSGNSQLQNGEAVIVFATSTSEIIDDSQPMKVSITLTADEPVITFVKEKSARGFTVKQTGNGISGATFDWIVIAKRKFVDPFVEEITGESEEIPPVEAESLTEQSSGDEGEVVTTTTTTSPQSSPSQGEEDVPSPLEGEGQDEVIVETPSPEPIVESPPSEPPSSSEEETPAEPPSEPDVETASTPEVQTE